jgi:photosystem II stability/assembly factor-like uncharacterized protein
MFAQWGWQNPLPQGKDLLDIHVFDSENAIAIGHMGTVIKTSDGGENWSVQNLVQEYTVLESVHFPDENNGWIVGHDSPREPLIFKTIDGGLAWTEINSFTTHQLHDVFFANTNTGWIVGNQGKIFKTTDSGNIWLAQNSSTGSSLLSVYFINENVGWAVGSDGIIIKTIDGGNNWFTQSSGATFLLSSVFFIDENYGWAVGDDGTILKTTNGGDDWLSYSIQTGDIFSVWFSNNNFGWITSGNQLFKTTNGGIDWFLQDTGMLYWFRSIQFLDNNNGWAVGDYSSIYKTSNGGDEWIQMSSSINRKRGNAIYFVNEKTGWVAFTDNSTQYDNELVKTTDGGESWIRLPVDWEIFALFFVSENIGWAGTYFEIGKTNDGGLTWEIQNIGSYIITDLYFLNENVGWAVGTGGAILKTTDGGNDWSLLSTTVNEFLQSVCFVNDSIGWTVGYKPYFVSVLKKTTDGGNSWISQNSPMGQIYSVCAINENLAWIAGGGIARTTDGGNIWVQQYSETFNKVVSFVDENNGWAVGESILGTSNGGEEWYHQFNGFLLNLASASFVSDTVGWVTGRYGTILKTTNGGIIVEVENNYPKPPTNILLSQNYPNPFNPVTSLQYTVGSRQFVTIKIYDLLGREIATLINEEKPAGEYKVEFNAANLPSGIYFYRIKAGSYINTKKMVLLK